MTKGSNKGYSIKLRNSPIPRKVRNEGNEARLLSHCYDPAFILSLNDYSIVCQNEAYTELLKTYGFESNIPLTHIIPKYQPNGKKSIAKLQRHKQELILYNKAQRFTLYIQDFHHTKLVPLEITVSIVVDNESMCLCSFRSDFNRSTDLDLTNSTTKQHITSEPVNHTLQHGRSNELLLKTLQEYQSIVNSSPAAILKTDPNGIITFVSKQAIYIHGFSEDKLLYKHVDDIFYVHGESMSSLLKRKLETQKKGQGRKILHIIHPSKGKRFIELKYFSLKNEGSSGYLLSYIDITEKENFKSSLQQSIAKLDSLIGFSKSDIIQIDLNGTIESISSNVNESMSQEKSNILGQKLSSFIAKKSHAKLNSFLQDVVQKNTDKTSEVFEIQFPNQTKEQIQFQGKVLFDTIKNKDSILLICHNCTDKIQSEIALIEKESTVHNLLENSPFSIYAIDTQYNVIFINKNAISDFKNYQKVEIQLGDNLEKIIPKNLLDNWKKTIFSRVFSGEKFSRTGLINGVKDTIIENKYSPLLDHEGNVSGCIEVSQNITYIKLKEYQLIEREAYLSSILNSSPDGIIVFDNVHAITGINPKAVEHFKIIYDQEITSTDNLKYILPRDVFNTIQTIQKRVFKGEVVSYVEKIESADQPMYFEHTYSPVKDKGNSIIGCKLLIRDETQVIAFEDILRQKNRELERYIESNLSLENFANIASHDLKSPLRTIIGFTQLLEREIKQDLSEKNKIFLAHIIKSSKNMQALIDDILLFSKLNAVEPKIEEIVFQAFLDFILSQIQDEVVESRSTITFENIPQFIRSDKVKLGQVFQNLIRNGIKFRRPGTTPKINISVENSDTHWQINITDNGIGIEEEYTNEIFQIFKKLHSKGNYPGSGIGLSTCQKLVESLGGTIWVNSIFGQGSTFSFTIPK